MIRLQKRLGKGQALLVVTPVRRRYLTNFNSSLGYLVITESDAFLLVDGRYYFAAKQSVLGAEVKLFDSMQSLVDTVVKLGVNEVLLENDITVAEYNRFVKLFEGLSVESNDEITTYIDQLRSVKTKAEVESIVSAQRIAEKAFEEVLNHVEVGVQENELAALLEYKMKLLGSEGESFDTIVVSGEKSAMPHGVPDQRALENGDFVTFDFGAVVNGYHSDMTRTIAVGFVTDKMHEVYNTVLSANLEAERHVKSGALCSDIDKAARSVIENAGYGEYFTHSTGHSVGLEIHETPSLSTRSSDALKIGNVVTNEPGIYIEGDFGVRIEDMLLVTENGSENLTEFEKNLIIL